MSKIKLKKIIYCGIKDFVSKVQDKRITWIDSDGLPGDSTNIFTFHSKDFLKPYCDSYELKFWFRGGSFWAPLEVTEATPNNYWAEIFESKIYITRE